MNKKGIKLATVASSAAVIALAMGIAIPNVVNYVKADNTENKASISRDTDITVDGSGILNIKRNIITTDHSADKSPWTLLIYIDGADLEQLSGFASKEIKEIISSNVTSENIENANIVFQTGGSFFWDDRNVNSKKTQRFILNEERGITQVFESELQNMGDPNTLSCFLEWGIKEYPAKRMGVIFWNHGSGIDNGVCIDPCFKFDSLSLAELEYAFGTTCKKMNRKFDFIGFDTCLSGSLEYTNVLAPYADYMIASAQTEPAAGWEYTTIVNTLLDNPDIEVKELGKVIVDSYFKYFEEKSTSKLDQLTLALYDLSKVDKVCMENNHLSKYMYDKVVQDKNNLDEFCKLQTSDEVTVYDENNIDIGSMINYIGKNTDYDIQYYKQALDEMVVYNRLSEEYSSKNSAGITLYLPKKAVSFKDLNIMRNVSVSPYYLQFLEMMNAKKAGDTEYDCNKWAQLDTYFENDFGYIDYELNGNNIDNRMYDKLIENAKYVADGFVDKWNNSFSLEKLANSNKRNMSDAKNSVKFTNDNSATVSDEYKNKIDKVYDTIFVKMGNDTVCLGQGMEAKYDATSGTIKSKFNGQWLMLPDGQLLTKYIDNSFDDVVYSIPVYINDAEMYIKIKLKGDSDYEVLGIWDGTDNTVQAGRGYIKLISGTVITPIYDIYNEETGEYETEIGEEYTIKSDSDFLFTKLQADEYKYALSIDNIYGETAYVAMVE